MLGLGSLDGGLIDGDHCTIGMGHETASCTLVSGVGVAGVGTGIGTSIEAVVSSSIEAVVGT